MSQLRRQYLHKALCNLGLGLGCKHSLYEAAFVKILQTVVDDNQMEYYETVRDAGAQLVNSLVHTLTKCTVESTEETTRMADTISALSSSPAFLPRETQVSRRKTYVIVDLLNI